MKLREYEWLDPEGEICKTVECHMAFVKMSEAQAMRSPDAERYRE